MINAMALLAQLMEIVLQTTAISSFVLPVQIKSLASIVTPMDALPQLNVILEPAIMDSVHLAIHRELLAQASCVTQILVPLIRTVFQEHA